MLLLLATRRPRMLKEKGIESLFPIQAMTSENKRILQQTVKGSGIEFLLFIWWGSAPYQGQEIKLKRGVDIVVGKPGRIKR